MPKPKSTAAIDHKANRGSPIISWMPAGTEQGIAAEQRTAVQLIAGALHRVAGCSDSAELSFAEGESPAILKPRKWESNPVLPRQEQLCSRGFGEIPRPREVVGVDMGIAAHSGFSNRTDP